MATQGVVTLGRPASVMRNRGHVTNGRDGHADRLQSAQRGFTTRTRARHVHFQGLDAMLCGLLAGILSSHLGRIGGRLPGALEAHHASAGPGDGVPLSVGDGDHGVVERGIHVCHARSDVLTLTPFNARRFFGHRIALLFLLAGDRLGRTLAGAGVCMGALTADRQALTVTQAAIAGQVHQTLDVDSRLTAQITFNRIVTVDGFTDLEHFRIGELVHTTGIFDTNLGHDLLCLGLADAMDVLKRDHNALVGRNVYAGDTGHSGLLLVTQRSAKGAPAQN